jgi:hypothetical protein
LLGYAGDVNSQLVTFTLPKKHENHDLSTCVNRKLSWKNLSSGAEGSSSLEKTTTTSETTWNVTWEVPPEAMTHAGTIEIAI